MNRKICAFACALIMVLSAAGCSVNSSDSSEAKSDESSVSSAAETDSSGADIQALDTSVDANDLDSGYDQQYSTRIAFSDSAAEVEGEGASADGTTVTINSAGTYILSGSCKNGRIIVSSGKKTEVKLVLEGLDLTCENNAPVYIPEAGKVIFTLAEGTENSLSDGSEYVLSDDEASVDAAVFSKADLTFNGTGSLSVTANYKHGIVSKDSLVISDGTLNVTSEKTGITGKDSVKIVGGTINVNAGSNGIKSSNSEDESLGFIDITGGSITVNSTGDALQAETSLLVEGGELDLTAGGGSANAQGRGGDMQMPGGFGNRGDREQNQQQDDGKFQTDAEVNRPEMPSDFGDDKQFPGGDFQKPDGDFPQMPDGDFPQPDGDFRNPDGSTDTDSSDGTSAKALKAGKSVVISGGTIKIDSSDDAIHANSTVTISGGTITAASGDDGVHADEALEISGSAELTVTKSYEGLEAKTITISGGKTDITASDDGLNASAGSTDGTGGNSPFGGISEGVYLKITGGELKVNASGDGLDSNGDFYMEGGLVYVSGPTNGGNGALDFGDGCTGTVTGGTLIAVGAVGMEEGFTAEGSTQCSFLHNLASAVNGGTEIKITDADGTELFSCTPEKNFQSIVFTSGDLALGETYTITAGSVSETVTLDSVAESNSTGGFGGGPGNMGGGRGNRGQR